MMKNMMGMLMEDLKKKMEQSQGDGAKYQGMLDSDKTSS